MKIRATKPFTLRDSDGKMTSYACNQIADVDDTQGAQLISDGLAEEYTLVSPTGSTNINANGTHNVAGYANAVVNVSAYTITYDVNGGSGSVASESVIAGNSVTLSDGTGITPPTDKTFSGWGLTSDATETIDSPYTPTASITLYAVYVD